MIPRFAAAVTAALALVACAGEELPPLSGPAPEVVTLDALKARMTPSGGERALLVNFWATW